jgi:hypothetical protein
MVTRASKPAVLDANAPDWARRFAASLEDGYVQANPTRPQLLPRLTSADLPNAADWPYCLVALTDINTVAMSTGSAWVRADGSAL